MTAVLAGALLFTLLRFASPDRTPPLASDPRAATAATLAAPATPSAAHLGITAFPRSARIVLDGQPLPGNPFHAEYPVDSEHVHVIEISAVDHRPERRSVRFDRDQQLVVTLEPVLLPTTREPSVSKPRVKAPTAARPSPAGASTDVGSDCDPPYYFSERGVKKFKPGCL
jgi:hypothetical protein